MKTVAQILSLPFILVIKLYQWIISPWLGNKCRQAFPENLLLQYLIYFAYRLIVRMNKK